MGLWFVTLSLILAIVAARIVVTHRSQPIRPIDSPRQNLIGRLVANVVVTAVIALVAITLGSLAAAVKGVVGVLIAVVVLIRTGYNGPIVPTANTPR